MAKAPPSRKSARGMAALPEHSGVRVTADCGRRPSRNPGGPSGLRTAKLTLFDRQHGLYEISDFDVGEITADFNERRRDGQPQVLPRCLTTVQSQGRARHRCLPARGGARAFRASPDQPNRLETGQQAGLRHG